MPIPDLLRLPAVLVPLPITEAFANLAYRRVLANHPQLFERLEAYRRCRFGFVPIDLPIAFVARPSENRISAWRQPLPFNAVDVRVEAPFAVLLELLQGLADGDALFFSREIQVEGDMEALLALRNALDDARIDLVDDVFGKAGPLAPFLKTVMRHVTERQSKEAGSWN